MSIMSRQARVAPGGMVYHVLNRSAGRFRMFRGERDFEAFQRVMIEAHRRVPLRVCAYCVLPNHWHFVPWPERDGQLTEFFRWLSHTHAMRWRVSHGTVGYGHLYQGRFKSFPIEEDASMLTVGRYVERNALTAGLVERAEDWRWCSLWARAAGDAALQSMLSPWPVDRPDDWNALVNKPLTAKEIERVRGSIARDRPFGSDRWIERTARRLGLAHTIRREGRPRGKTRKNAKN
jgi:putative transposase